MTDVKLLLVHSSVQDCLTVCKQLIESDYNDLHWMEIFEIIWLWRKISSGSLKNIINKMFTNHMFSLFNYVQTNCWCWVELLVLCSSSAWSHLIVCRQVNSGSFGILSTEHLFANLGFNVYKWSLALSGLQGFLCH